MASPRAAPPILTAPPPVLALPILAFTQPTPTRGLAPSPEPVAHAGPSAKPSPAPPPPIPTIVTPPKLVAPAPWVRPVHAHTPVHAPIPALKPVRTKVLRAVLRRPEKARRNGKHWGKYWNRRHDKHRPPGFKGPVFTTQPPNYISPYVATNHTDGPPLDWPPRALRICDGPKAKLVAACRDLAAAR